MRTVAASSRNRNPATPENFRQVRLKRLRSASYTDHVAHWRRLAFTGLAALFLCLPGSLQAQTASAGSQDIVYTIHLFSAVPPAKIELSVAPASAAWDVTADYDSTLCEIHCSWRRKHDPLGRTPAASLILPPAAVVRIFRGFAAPPVAVVVNPAGLGLPSASQDSSTTPEPVFVPAKQFSLAAPGRLSDCSGANELRPPVSSATGHIACTAAALPLRI